MCLVRGEGNSHLQPMMNEIRPQTDPLEWGSPSRPRCCLATGEQKQVSFDKSPADSGESSIGGRHGD